MVRQHKVINTFCTSNFVLFLEWTMMLFLDKSMALVMKAERSSDRDLEIERCLQTLGIFVETGANVGTTYPSALWCLIDSDEYYEMQGKQYLLNYLDVQIRHSQAEKNSLLYLVLLEQVLVNAKLEADSDSELVGASNSVVVKILLEFGVAFPRVRVFNDDSQNDNKEEDVAYLATTVLLDRAQPNGLTTTIFHPLMCLIQ